MRHDKTLETRRRGLLLTGSDRRRGDRAGHGTSGGGGEGFVFAFAVFGQFCMDLGLDEAGAVPSERDYVEGGDAAVGVVGQVMGGADEEGVGGRVEGVLRQTCL